MKKDRKPLTLEEDEPPLEPEKTHGISNLKLHNELFQEHKYIPSAFIRVKRIAEDEAWEIYEGNELKLTLPGHRFKNYQKKYFQTVEGVNFLMKAFRQGNTQLKSMVEAVENLNLPGNRKKT